ncbi:MAG: anmK [Hyphomonadaceae bacterium]|nr:MAG: anmK [Hyphomonadaceae bacterium]KAF0186311.1 MAG: anmK [Hyphomonadaceae bacterium]
MRDYWAIGLMTGTALDGYVDVALIRTDGHKILELGPYELVPYSDAQREILWQAVHAALDWQFNGPPPSIFEAATATITLICTDGVEALLQKTGFDKSKIDYVGAHGLTVLHHPPKAGEIGQTLQLLDGAKLAKTIGIPVIYDFRANDMRHGGQGAPLAPIYHAALLQFANLEPPAAILNLGGVANITYWAGGTNVAAFDCGPANGPINELVEAHKIGTYDKNGALASKGRVDMARLAKIMENPWFAQPFPKSLDRYDFGAALVDSLALEDGCSTLSALVGMAVGRGLDLLAQRPTKLVVAGGGRKNPKMMHDIENFAKIDLIDADEIGLRGDAVEAECFAFLAVRSALGLPISFPNTTNVKAPITGGVLARP